MTVYFSVTPSRTIPAIAMFLVLVDLGFLVMDLKPNPESLLSAIAPGVQVAAFIADLIGGIGVIFFGFFEVTE